MIFHFHSPHIPPYIPPSIRLGVIGITVASITLAFSVIPVSSENTILIILLTATVGFVGTWFWRRVGKAEADRDTLQKRMRELEDKEMILKRTQDDRAPNAARIRELESKVEIMQQQVSPLWAAVQARIAKDLTHPHPGFEKVDALLVKLQALTITDEERIELNRRLDARIVTTDPRVSQQEKDSASLMRIVSKKVLEEAADDNPFDDTINREINREQKIAIAPERK